MEYTIIGIKWVAAKHGKTITIIIDFKGEMVDLFSPKRFDSKADDFDKKNKKLDKGMVLKVTERKKKII